MPLHRRARPVQSTAPAEPPAAAAAGMADVDAKLERLSASKAAWAAASLDERIQLLKDVRARLLDQVRWLLVGARTRAPAQRLHSACTAARQPRAPRLSPPALPPLLLCPAAGALVARHHGRALHHAAAPAGRRHDCHR